MEHVYTVLETALQKRGSATYLRLLQAWSEIMGDLAERTRLENCNGGVLVIGVYDPQWLQELRLLSRTIKQEINSYCDDTIVHDVRLKLVSSRKRKSHTAEPASKQPVFHISQLPARYHEILQRIKDPELRDALYRFYCYGEKT